MNVKVEIELCSKSKKLDKEEMRSVAQFLTNNNESIYINQPKTKNNTLTAEFTINKARQIDVVDKIAKEFSISMENYGQSSISFPKSQIKKKKIKSTLNIHPSRDNITMVNKQYASIVGAILWYAVAVWLAILGISKTPHGEILVPMISFLLGLFPGLIALRRLAIANMMALDKKPEKIMFFRIFIPRFWVMIIIMPSIGFALRFLPDNLWWILVGYLLLSSAALVCGATTFLFITINHYRKKSLK